MNSDDDEDIDDEYIMILMDEDEKDNKHRLRFGKGNSRYTKADYRLYEASDAVTRVMCTCERESVY